LEIFQHLIFQFQPFAQETHELLQLLDFILVVNNEEAKEGVTLKSIAVWCCFCGWGVLPASVQNLWRLRGVILSLPSGERDP